MRPRVVLQVSRFPWAEDPSRWLRDWRLPPMRSASTALALMDHLIQIPQVDRVGADT